MDRFKNKVKTIAGRGKKAETTPGSVNPETAVVPRHPESEELAVASSSKDAPKKAYIAETSRYNFDIVHNPPNPVVDIIFLHGLTGDREKTWTRTKGKMKCFWPEDLLAEDIKDARIAVWGYDATVIKKTPFAVVSTNTLDHHAQTLCSDLAGIRVNGHNQPIIFVVHSLGGLVCKAALLHSSEAKTTERAHLKDVSDNTCGIAFMGTPHQGSSKASWGGMLASVLGYVKQDNKQIVEALDKEAPHLNELQKRFLNLLEYRKEVKDPISITCFFEELPLPVVGTVVPDQSATILGYEGIGIHDDHSGMTKFGSDESPGYKRVLAELNRWVGSIHAKKAGNEKGEEHVSAVSAQANISNTNYGSVGGGGVALIGNQKFENSGTTNFGGSHTVNSGVREQRDEVYRA